MCVCVCVCLLGVCVLGVCVQALTWGWGWAWAGSVTKVAWALRADSGGHPQGAPSPHQQGPRQATHSLRSLWDAAAPGGAAGET